MHVEHPLLAFGLLLSNLHSAGAARSNQSLEPTRVGKPPLAAQLPRSTRRSLQPPPLRPERLRPAREGPQHRPTNRPHVGPPEAVPIWLDVARPGDREPPEFAKVQRLVWWYKGERITIHGEHFFVRVGGKVYDLISGVSGMTEADYLKLIELEVTIKPILEVIK